MIRNLLAFLAGWALVPVPGFSQTEQPTLVTETLQVVPLTPNTFQHISYLQTETWGKVGCNGLVVVSNGEALVLDTPVDAAASEALLDFLENDLRLIVKGVVATHFHDDCLGGLAAFHRRKIPSFGIGKTLALAQAAGYEAPRAALTGESSLPVGSAQVQLFWPGPGHTPDNIVAYFAPDGVLFGGCLVKADGAGKGFLGDADVVAWPATVERVLETFPQARVVVPGHGDAGGPELLSYTVRLFQADKE